MESLVLPMTIHELSILARGIHGAFVAWAAWLKEWSTWESHALQSRTLQRWGPQSCTQKQFGNGKSLLNPPGRCLNWFDWEISDHFGIRKTCRKLGLSQNEGWPNFTAIFMGATGSQKCNWSNPEARRTSASRSGHLWFSDFLQHLFQCCSISQQCQRFQKDQTGFQKTCPNKQVLFVTNLLSELSTLSQLIFRLVLTCQQGLWRKENTFGNWIGWELSVGLYKSKTYLPKDFVDFSILFPFYSAITGSTILQLFLHDRTRAYPLISDWSMVLTFVRSPVPELIRGCSLFGGWHDRAIHGLRHCLLLHGVSGQELPGQRSKTWNLRISRPVASCTSTLVDHYIQMLDWLKQWLPKDYDYCMY